MCFFIVNQSVVRFQKWTFDQIILEHHIVHWKYIKKYNSEYVSIKHCDRKPLLIDRHPMPFQDKEVAGIIENVYSKFKLMLIKKDEPSKVNKELEMNI